MTYPVTRPTDTADTHFGQTIADPFRWLENDPRRDPEVADWITAQNALSAPYLAGLAGRDVFRQRLTTLFDHASLTPPVKRGSSYFFTRNSGLDNQAQLFVRDGVEGADRVLIDPNSLAEDGTTALAEWAPSADGAHLAFALQEGGTDWRTLRVMDTATGEILEDTVEWARFTNIAWNADGSGFFYSRFPEPEAGATFDAAIDGHAVYFHRLGTPQAEDALIHAPSPGKSLVHTVDVTPDGRYLLVYTSALTGGAGLTVTDLSSEDRTARTIIESFDDSWTVLGNVGSKLFLSTQKDAPRGKVMTIDLAESEPAFVELIPEKDAVLREGSAAVLGDRIVLSYMVDARTRVERYRLDGTPEGLVDLPGPGTTGAFHGKAGDDEAFFAFTSYDAPLTIHRLEVAGNRTAVWAEPDVALDLDQIAVEPHFYTSKDGTRVPLFVVRRKDVTGPAPTMLYAYGGFAISMVPYYSPAAMAWVEQGGAYVVANIRGGSEYGSAWHHAGRRGNKQNVFDDFIAAGEYLKAEGITSQDGLAIHGESNGGLLVGAVVNQRPDLFAAALPGVGVMDMLRFDRFTSGSMWVQEYGSPAVEEEFRTLLAYSPLHTVREGTPYPAILATTADTDNRVVPAHSFKYVATLQAADLGPRPHLLRVETRAGHGAGKPMTKVIEEIADIWAFAAEWTGLEVAMPD
ncbi:prolyl oligopeptidase family serine peptidase [Frigidibacter albus]|uniref:prolyl oligopeptidase n=1 Tax=Frigidibacter albus TaxID=1465486 RepID=A0A6L8VHR7_9RHOB|nr:prolyl oligopeptidase family serine peptidase [Frigidibacter albus]MZQ89261.1 prolyl oligopeptidase family serine peptidase [Frigidibacter albus]NBE31167.1 prolyl oligopeptidase family serine peptidase [Frigidibacter albus]